jgi:hypothetical protein
MSGRIAPARQLVLGSAIVLLAAAAACHGESYGVRVILGDEGLGDHVRNVDVYLVDDCDDLASSGAAPDTWVAAVHFAPEEAADRLGEVEPGEYGLYAVLRDEDCQAIAAGCAQVSLEAGAGGDLSVEVTRIDGRGCDHGARCELGQCVSEGGDADADADADADTGCSEAQCRDGRRDSCCPAACTPTSDLDCCDLAACSMTADGCCPEGCTAASDQDCCDAAECRAPADTCCPSSCRVSEDSDCCEAADCNMFDEDGCCPAHCNEYNDDDC